MIGNVHVKPEGNIAESLAKIDPPAYDNFIHMENGKKVLYVKLHKALNGTLQAVFLFWQTLSEELLKWGFEVNPYNWCISNRMINGKQCRVLWHIDDIKISHVGKNFVTQVLDQW